MSRSGLMFLAGTLVLVFGIFFGVELAQRGLERVSGPLGPAERTEADAGQAVREARPGKPANRRMRRRRRLCRAPQAAKPFPSPAPSRSLPIR